MTQAALPDTLIALIPCPWDETLDPDELNLTHQDHWQEGASYQWEVTGPPGEMLATGRVTFEGDEHSQAALWIEPPSREILEARYSMSQPLSAPEGVLLREHKSLWRFDLKAGSRLGRRAAKRMSQIMATMIEAGASAVLLPGVGRLHPAQFVRLQTMDLHAPEAMANLFVGAWHHEGWMRSRGLTAFGLPEIETSTAAGLNGAYFQLMDVAANMLAQHASYPDGGTLEIGRDLLSVHLAPKDAPEDPANPLNGVFGVQRLIKTS